MAHAFPTFSKNGELLPMAEAAVPLSSIEYAYGFGVYETLRAVNGTIYFAEDHVERLLASASAIGLAHTFTGETILLWLKELLKTAGAPACNIKMLLIGAPRPEDAALYMLPLAPLFPDDSLYKKGATCILYEYERLWPHAKTLNMLGSYLAYRAAKEKGAYDALLVDRAGTILEGTRTNIFFLRGSAVVSPPLSRILPGVTRKAMLGVAETINLEYVEEDVRPADLSGFDAAFLTSTSSKIIPIRRIGEHDFGDAPEQLRTLMRAFDALLSSCHGIMPH